MSGLLPRIALVTPTIPVPPRSGSEVVTAGLLETLHRIGLVDVFTLVPPLDLESRDRRLRALCSACESAHTFLWNRRPTSWWPPAALDGLPAGARRNFCPELLSELTEWCRVHPRAVLVADHWLSAETVLRARRPGQPCVLHAHHAAHVVCQRQGSHSWLQRWRQGRQARHVARYERRLVESFDRVIALSGLDARRLGALAPGVPAGRIGCIRPGVERLAGPAGWSVTRPQVLAVGTLAWPPNVQGLDRFVSEVWPAFRGRWPEAKLVVVGGGLSPALRRRYAGLPGVELRGFVADLDGLYAQSRLFVAPVAGGSGVQIKVLHALARGVPVLTTPEGAEGIDLPAGLLGQFASAEEFVARAGVVWDRPAAWQELSTTARAEVLQRYRRSQAAADWTDLVAQLTAAPAQPAAGRREAA